MTQLPNDPPIDEIREIRRKISAEHGHDAARLVTHYIKLQEQYQGRLIDKTSEPERPDDAMSGVAPKFPGSLFVDLASRFNKDGTTPIHVPAETIAFLHRLGAQGQHAHQPYYDFLLRIGLDDLPVTIKELVLTAEARSAMCRIQELQLALGHALVAQDFDLAYELRDQRNELRAQLTTLNRGVVELQPEHVAEALRRLGYQGVIE